MISDKDRSVLRSVYQSDMDLQDDLIGHCFTDRNNCFTNYLIKTVTAHAPTHVACHYQPAICVIAVNTGFVVSLPAVH